MTNERVIVVGGGIAGLTASALLAHQGVEVILLESHSQTGGCAGTYKRGKYVFDVGATQVAGLEKGGIHERVFRYLQWPKPYAQILDPGCVVDLGDGSRPIQLWHDPIKWEKERNEQFPESERFWSLCSFLHKINWDFAKRDAILPFSNFWDLKQFVNALKPLNGVSGLFSKLSVADLLVICSCHKDQRLKNFLDLQLQLYSQESSARTAALYGATVLQMAQAPLGLWHLQGSMQKLSNALESCLIRDGAQLLLNHKVVNLVSGSNSQSWEIELLTDKGSILKFSANDVIFTLPPQCLLTLMKDELALQKTYRNRLTGLPKPTGAIVFYGAIARHHIGKAYSNHMQLFVEQFGSLFFSISEEGDGRAPRGEVTVIVSAFTSVSEWNDLDGKIYQRQKAKTLTRIISVINSFLNIASENWLHKELATPRSFAKWTGRPQGIVGGLGQTPAAFGPFGLSSRTPFKGLWLCGDSIYPGEGTAGVTQSALMACRQLMANRGENFTLPQ